MRYYYDLHIHSCLSPCGDSDMTPCNIVNMAALKQLDVIAITDHNSCKNAPAVLEAAKEVGLLALAGMELTTREDVHILTLFSSLDGALRFGDFVEERRLRIINREDIYGSQIIMDARDVVTGKERDLLLTAADIGVYETAELALKYGGVALPAHIDRESNGLIAILGEVERGMGFKSVELSLTASAEFKRKYADEGYFIVSDSDAHYLENIAERGDGNFLELDSLSAENVIAAIIRQGNIN